MVKQRLRGEVKLKIVGGTGALIIDPGVAAKTWGVAHMVIGPHGGALANVIACQAGTAMLVFSTLDTGGSPASHESYFSYMAHSLDMQYDILGEPNLPVDFQASFYQNYTFMHDPEVKEDVISSIVNWVRSKIEGPGGSTQASRPKKAKKSTRTRTRAGEPEWMSEL